MIEETRSRRTADAGRAAGRGRRPAAPDLIRIDTTNSGDTRDRGSGRPPSGSPAKLDEVGIESQILESAPGRASVVARIEGADRVAAGRC